VKTAIASNGKDEKAQVSEVSGRAPYFLIFEDGKLTKTIKNPFNRKESNARKCPR